jgi:hypothetical protein
VHTVSTVQVNHPTLAPAGVFEYQHSGGETLNESVAEGLAQWVKMDFVVLVDALRPKPGTCSAMEMSFPAKEGLPARKRRAVLGPVYHARNSGERTEPEEHPFCPCCLLTNSFEAFKDLVMGYDVHFLRLFAMREHGEVGADCRVDGHDFEPGAEALRAYARTWPGGGFEVRKQLVVVQSVEISDAES